MYHYRRRIRQFFFISLFSGALMVFSSFAVPPQWTNSDSPLSFLGQLKTTTENASGVVKNLSLKDIKEARSMEDLKELLRKAEEVDAGLENLNTYKIEGRKGRYVYIEGQYYKYNSSNVYRVNGLDVYYVDNSRHRNNSVNAIKAEIVRRKKRGIVSDEGTYKPSFGVGSMSPGNMKKMMEGLKKAQKNMKARNGALEEFMNSSSN